MTAAKGKPDGQRVNLAGQRFGRLEVLRYADTLNKRARWFCLCDCGTKIIVLGKSLRQGNTKSCGCLNREKISDRAVTRNYKHGHAIRGLNSREYASWCAMINRCENPNHDAYPRYGGMGIRVCKRWRVSFANFLADMGPRPTGKSLDRYPNKFGDYKPGNCRWATPSEQQTNRRDR